MPRLLLLITDLEIGGTPTVVRELAIRLRTRLRPGSQIQVACLAGWGPVVDQIRAAGIRVTPLNARGPLDLSVIPRLSSLLCEQRIDTVLSFLIHANAVAAAVSLLHRGVRFIQSIQTTQPYPRWHWRLQRFIAPAADRIIVPSSSVKEAAIDRSAIPPEQITIIPNAIDPSDFAGITPIPPDTRPFPIGFIGRLDPVKRIADLLSAMPRLSGLVHLHIFGAGPELPHLHAQIDRLGIAPHVTLHGTVARPRLALERIGLLVLPSQAEGLPMVLIEAMAAGVPIVATDVPGIRDVIRHEITGLLVPPASPAELAQAIQRILTDHPLRQRLTEAAAAQVVRDYTWSAVLPHYQTLLLEP